MDKPEKTNISEPANFKPSRFLEKKQQALLLQGKNPLFFL